MNEALLAKAHEAKVLKMNRLRADTTVVEADVAYPSDSGLLSCGDVSDRVGGYVAACGRGEGQLHDRGAATDALAFNQGVAATPDR